MLKKCTEQKINTGKGLFWNEEDIKDGFEHFKKINNRYPTVREIDTFKYLPTSRTLQRRFNGTVGIREKFGLDITDYTTGQYRSKVAKNSYKRAEVYEEKFYKKLISKIPEVRVHEQKRIRPGNVSSDFFIYDRTGKSGIIIDLFYTDEIRNVTGIINIKNKRYSLVGDCRILYVVISKDINDQKEVSKLIENRKIKMPENIEVYVENTFWDFIANLLYRAEWV